MLCWTITINILNMRRQSKNKYASNRKYFSMCNYNMLHKNCTFWFYSLQNTLLSYCATFCIKGKKNMEMHKHPPSSYLYKISRLYIWQWLVPVEYRSRTSTILTRTRVFKRSPEMTNRWIESRVLYILCIYFVYFVYYTRVDSYQTQAPLFAFLANDFPHKLAR